MQISSGGAQNNVNMDGFQEFTIVLCGRLFAVWVSLMSISWWTPGGFQIAQTKIIKKEKSEFDILVSILQPCIAL